MDSVLVIDKPAGMTSHDVVARVRKLVGERSVGHLGTLDPMATGVLPLVLGRYTRLAQFYTSAIKGYEGKIRLGFATDTYDAEGDPATPVKSFTGTLEDVRKAAQRFAGTLRQLPPPFSAKKIAGVPAYKLARKKQPVELMPVEVQIFRFEISALEGDEASFQAEVSSGTYIRSLAHDLGQTLGVGGHLSQLRRSRSGEFCLDQAIGLKELAALVHAGRVEGRSIHPREILEGFPAVTIGDEQVALIANGRSVNLPEFSKAKFVKVFWGRDRLIAIAARIAGTLFQPKVVLLGGTDKSPASKDLAGPAQSNVR